MTDDNLFGDIENFLLSQTGKQEGSLLFTEDEYEAIILRFLVSRGEAGASEDEVMTVIRWCEQQRVGNTIVDLLLKGILDVDLKDNEPVVQLSEAGKLTWEKK